jgi:hypothetical protein
MRLTDLASICAGQPYLPCPNFLATCFPDFLGYPQSLGGVVPYLYLYQVGVLLL